MFIDSYQVEELSLATHQWAVLRRFCLKYKWANVKRRFLFLLRRPQPEIVGSKLLQAVVVKANAYNYARRIMRIGRPQSIRITRIDREGARFVKVVIWLDGEWNE